MGTTNDAFGWGRSYEGEDVSGLEIKIHGLDDHRYTVTWYDTWSGNKLSTSREKPQNGILVLHVPELDNAHPDVAFKIRE